MSDYTDYTPNGALDADYTPEQLGSLDVRPLSKQTKGEYSVVVIQPKSNIQVLVFEPCSWDTGRERTVQMVKAGVDPWDIRYVYRNDHQTEPDAGAFGHCQDVGWWTAHDAKGR